MSRSRSGSNDRAGGSGGAARPLGGEAGSRPGGTGGPQYEPVLQLPADAVPYGDAGEEEGEGGGPEDQLQRKMFPVADRVITVPMEVTISDALIMSGWIAAKLGSEPAQIPLAFVRTLQAAAFEALGFYNPPAPVLPVPATQEAEPAEPAEP